MFAPVFANLHFYAPAPRPFDWPGVKVKHDKAPRNVIDAKWKSFRHNWARLLMSDEQHVVNLLQLATLEWVTLSIQVFLI